MAGKIKRPAPRPPGRGPSAARVNVIGTTAPQQIMINPAKLKHGGLFVILLIGTTAVDASIAPLASKSTLVSKSPSALSVPVTELAPTSGAFDIEVDKTFPRGGDGELRSASRLKVGSYFSIWYILNIIYNSKYVGVFYC